MNKKHSLIISAIFAGTSLVMYVLTYICFHYVTDNGFTSVKQEEAGKPFVANCMGTFATLCMFGALVFLLLALVACNEKKNK